MSTKFGVGNIVIEIHADNREQERYLYELARLDANALEFDHNDDYLARIGLRMSKWLEQSNHLITLCTLATLKYFSVEILGGVLQVCEFTIDRANALRPCIERTVLRGGLAVYLEARETLLEALVANVTGIQPADFSDNEFMHNILGGER